MSNKTRLQTNNTNLQTLIDKANALPDAGSGSGGSASIDTCTVILSMDADADLLMYGYTCVTEDGNIDTIYVDLGTNKISGQDVIVNRVLCGSLFYVHVYGPYLSIGCTNIDACLDAINDPTTEFYKAPSVKDDIGTIYFTGDD